MIKNLPKFTGDVSEFARWKNTVAIEAFSATSGIWDRISTLMSGMTRPTDREERASWDKTNAIFYSILYLLVRGEAAGILRKYKPNREHHGNGIGAWNALTAKYEGKGKQRNIDLHRSLDQFEMQPKEDPDNFFARLFDLQDKLADLDEPVTDARLISFVLNRVPNEYEAIREVEYKTCLLYTSDAADE